MTQLSNNFKRSEFKCNCGKCNYDTVDRELVTVLQDLRDALGPVTITSGHRCPEYNEQVGGVPTSYHVLGRAADVVVAGKEPFEVAEYLRWKYPDQYGIGEYENFVHIDTRNDKGRW